MMDGGAAHTPSLSTTGMTDREIVQAIAAGNEDVWQSVTEWHAKRLGTFISRIAGGVATREDIEECVADCFIDLWEKASLYDPNRGTLTAWLYFRALYKARSLRTKRRQRREDSLEEQALQEVADVAEPPHDEAVNRLFFQQVVHPLLAALSPVDQEIIRQRIAKDRSPKEIADALGITPNAVRVRLSRIRKRLRKEFGSGV